MTEKPSPPPPPRLTGEQEADSAALQNWNSAFYDNAMRGTQLLDPAKQYVPDAFDADNLPDPTDSSIANAQQTANEAYGRGSVAYERAIPVGAIVDFPKEPSDFYAGGGGTVLIEDIPSGVKWLEMDGSILPIEAFPDLAEFLGTTYGGDGEETFGIPNVTDTSRYRRSRGVYAEGAYQSDQIAAHQHSLTAVATSSSGEHSHTGLTGEGGDHSHLGSTQSAGSHNHGGATGAGGDHNHGSISSSGAHTHTTDSDGTHSHTSTSSDGDHTHTVALAQAGQAAAGALGFHTNTSNTTTSTNGAHTHSVTSTGSAHTHSISSSGSHTHTISASGTHTHTISTEAAHAHVISASGTHTHTISTELAHTHTVTGNTDIFGTGNTETRPETLVVVTCIRT